jgi:hypothetical protein
MKNTLVEDEWLYNASPYEEGKEFPCRLCPNEWYCLSNDFKRWDEPCCKEIREQHPEVQQTFPKPLSKERLIKHNKEKIEVENKEIGRLLNELSHFKQIVSQRNKILETLEKSKNEMFTKEDYLDIVMEAAD